MKVALVCTAMALAIVLCTGAGIPRKTREMNPIIENILKNVPKSVILEEMKKWLDPHAVSSMDDKLKKFLESLKQNFTSGFPQFGIPPLDPFFLKKFDYNIDQEYAKLTGFFENANITGISTYSIDYTKLDVFRLAVSANFSIPSIVATGYYDIDGEIVDLLPVYGNGNFRLAVIGFNASIVLRAGTKDGFVFIKELDIGFSLDKLESNFEGLLGGGDQGDLANQMISDIAPDVLNDYSPEISSMLSGKIVEFANNALTNVTLSDLLHIISG